MKRELIAIEQRLLSVFESLLSVSEIGGQTDFVALPNHISEIGVPTLNEFGLSGGDAEFCLSGAAI